MHHARIIVLSRHRTSSYIMTQINFVIHISVLNILQCFVANVICVCVCVGGGGMFLCLSWCV